MKNLIRHTLKNAMAVMLMAFALCNLCSADDGFKIDRSAIQVELVNAPEIDIKGVNKNFSAKVDNVNKWLMIKIEFTPEQQRQTVSQNRGGRTIRSSVDGWFDNVTMSARVLLDTGLEANRRPLYVMFTGRTVFWSIRRDGKRHLALMFVPAQLIDRYSVAQSGGRRVNRNRQFKIDGVKNSRVARTKDFIVEVTFTTANGELGREYFNCQGSTLAARRRYFTNLYTQIPQGRVLEGAVLSRSKSPWALIKMDDFDFERDSVPGNK